MATETAFDESDLNAFADGRLEPGRAAALAESLSCDRLARARIDAWKRQNDGLRTLFASVLFEPVPVRLLPTTFVGSGDAKVPVPTRAAGVVGGIPSGAVLAVTAIGVALIGFVAGALATIATDGFGGAAWRPHAADILRPATEIRPLDERAAETFRAALADPARATEFAGGDEARLQHWMTRQLSGAARIPDLRPQGWKLIGGHVVPGKYAQAAFLTYAQGAERLGLYVAREPVPAVVRTSAFAAGAVTVSSWSQDGLGIALTSTGDILTPESAVEPVRDAVRRQMTDDASNP